MNRRGAGAAFCAMAVFLQGVRWISAALFGSGVSSWSGELFSAMLEYPGNGLTVLSLLCLAAGIFYLVWAEIKKEP